MTTGSSLPSRPAPSAFEAPLVLDDATSVVPLVGQLRASNEQIAAPFVRRALADGAGVVSFHRDDTVAMQVSTAQLLNDTHVGAATAAAADAIRHILNVGHEPIAITDVVWCDPSERSSSRTPQGTASARHNAQRAIEGVADTSASIGIPVVAGALLHDVDLAATPVVQVGCIGRAHGHGTDADQPASNRAHRELDAGPYQPLAATLPIPNRTTTSVPADFTPSDTLLQLLAHPNIASKEHVVRQYDHEIRGATLVRPLVGVASDAPADGVVLAEPTDHHGLSIGIGTNPWFGMLDPERMAHAAVDEAIRTVVAAGADPNRVALFASFTAGDTGRPSVVGELVATVAGCCTGAAAYRAPIVGYSDTLNVEHISVDGVQHTAPTSVTFTAVAHVPDVERVCTPQLTAPGNLLVAIGTTANEFGGSHYAMVKAMPLASSGVVPAPDLTAPDRYHRLHLAIRAGIVRSCHDVSEGGLAVAIAEMCIAGRLGVRVDRLPHPDTTVALFSESTGRLVCEIAPTDLERFTQAIDGPLTVLGEVTATRILSLPGVTLRVDELVAAFTGGAVE